MANKKNRYDLIVIGSGAGGGAGANYAASLGKKVLLFEKGLIGGECPNIGCIPTKALLTSADAWKTATGSKHLGITSSGAWQWNKIQQWKDRAVAETGTSEGIEAFESAGVHTLTSEARFVGPHKVEAGGELYYGKNFLIATGTRTFIPPVDGLVDCDFITSTEALELKPPDSILIIGGGAIGCEFAELFAAFGSKVYIVEFMPRLLFREDAEVGELIAAVFEQKGIHVLTDTKVVSAHKSGTNKTVSVEKKGKHHNLNVDQILVATGKVPVIENLNLDKAGVRFDKKGIIVNSYMETSSPHIYAAGDVVGPYQFTHTAEYQSHLAAFNAFHRKKLRADYRSVPRCVFVDPEIACAGMTESEAESKGIKYRVGEAPLSIIGRANTSGQDTGFAKIIVDSRDRIIGASIVCPRAGEMIHELTLAIQLGATYQQVASTIHAFPTFSELVRYACSAVK